MGATPFRVTFALSRPMRVPQYPIHLDALLAWASVQEAGESGMDDPLPAQEDLPLAQDGEGDLRVWCASQLLYRQAEPPFELLMTKRFELNAFASGRGRVYTGGCNKFTSASGAYKSFIFWQSVVWTGAVVAYGLGDVNRVRELLDRVHTIGKYRRLSMGKVRTVSVEEDARAIDAWRFRIMPTPRPDYHPIEAVTRAPYWDRTRRRIAYAPNAIPGDLYVEL